MSGRHRAERITDITTYPHRWVRMIVAAEFLGVDVRTLRKWVDRGLIIAVPFGKHHRIPREVLKAFHEKHTAA